MIIRELQGQKDSGGGMCNLLGKRGKKRMEHRIVDKVVKQWLAVARWGQELTVDQKRGERGEA